MKIAPLSRKLFTWILFAASVPAIILTIVYLISFRNALLQQEVAHLSQLADAKVEQIENYIDEAIIDSRLLSKSLSTMQAFNTLTPLHRDRNKKADLFRKTEISFHKYFQIFQDRGYYDIFLITPAGDIVLTLKHEIDFTSNIFTGPYHNSGLSHAAQRAKLLMESSTSSFEYYKPSDGAAAFIATPVLASGKLLGILAIQIDTDILQNISQNTSSLMQSREILIGAKKGKTFSFQIPVKFGPQFIVGKKIPLHKKSGPLMNAMKGISGITFDKDYRGIETISASRYIPSLNWGLALKEDLDEVLYVFNQMVNFSLIILFTLLISIAFLARYLGHSISKPLKSITKVTREIADGKIDLKVQPEGFYESFKLAESFNQMSEHLKLARDELEQRVKNRTHELELKNNSLKQEITARINAEEIFQETSQNLSDAQHMAHIGNWKLDLVKNELKWSDEIFQIFEIDQNKFDATYEAFLNGIHPDDREKVNKAYTESIKNKIPYSINHRLRMPDGRIKYVQEHSQTFYDNAGNPTLSKGTVQDITKQVSMEETLRRSQKMDALGKLTGGIAHDYNNMLGVILGYSELLKQLLKDQPEPIKYIDEIHHAGERGANLTQKLMSFSRQKISDSEILNINDLLHDKQLMLEKTLTARIKLILNLDDNLWPVWLDIGDLEDAIINLSINSMHAIDGNGQITIQTQNVQLNNTDAQILQIKPGDYVQLNLTDTGSGMNEATKEKIFEPFFSTKGEKGTGLGLSQVYGFMQRSGGAIKVYSELDHGTRMVLYFSRYQQTDSKEKKAEETTINNFEGSETILVVDDEPAVLNLTCEILRQHGYHTICVDSAQQALNILEKEHIDLLLSDVIMPEIDGYQLATMVQKKYPEIKIQLASGFTDNRHINMVDDSLHRNLIYKPYQSAKLLKKLRELLESK